MFVGDLLGVLHAVDVESGEVRWRFPTGAEIKSSPVVADDLVLIGSYDEYFYAVDRTTGKLRWKLQTEGPVHATPGRANGLAWVTGCDAVLRGVRITDGTEMIRFDSGAYTAASPAIFDETLYYGTFNNEVLAVDVGAGALRWRYEHPERHFPFYASAAVAGDIVIVAGRDKLVHALDRATGEARWTFRARARFDASPAVAGDRVYVGNADGRLYVLDLQTGEKVFEFHAGAAIMGSPAIAGGRSRLRHPGRDTLRPSGRRPTDRNHRGAPAGGCGSFLANVCAGLPSRLCPAPGSPRVPGARLWRRGAGRPARTPVKPPRRWRPPPPPRSRCPPRNRCLPRRPNVRHRRSSG